MTEQGDWTAEKVITVIRELAQQNDLPAHLADATITEADTVETLGIDSIGGAYLVERFEEMTDILMPDDFVELRFTLAEVAQRLNQAVAENS